MTQDQVSRPKRRTQQERRAATVAKLIDATIDAISELGYHRTTIQEICERAGLSVGAMFRQFDGRLDLIVATAQEIVTRQLTTFRALLAEVGDGDDALRVALRFMREAQQSKPNVALREVFIAARSDRELHARIAPAASGYYDAIMAEAERSGVMRRFPEHVREPLFFTVLHVFSGQSVVRAIYDRPDLDESVLEFVYDLLTTYAGTEGPARM
ncbi:TetR/AcrR family transcriptional regulator [Nocardia sp. CDC159]|uniref:TetR/AcrR family transcriptional regulator n=1 Tax=Nocardia pulmonis TaxID=2951408 RepID=A0A9X2EGD4_9NOCA|nr:MULTISPECIES: TetR/AcrR family transcriptional regulator [Nocardia]MCM6777688.1 TetR/AcrR family transcriptional regulator [Nocardia pulmonis]MCM6790508.1 TetR/AcrR family transcriptional regulator [Nocardia sp. CDC159]